MLKKEVDNQEGQVYYIITLYLLIYCLKNSYSKEYDTSHLLFSTLKITSVPIIIKEVKTDIALFFLPCHHYRILLIIEKPKDIFLDEMKDKTIIVTSTQFL